MRNFLLLASLIISQLTFSNVYEKSYPNILNEIYEKIPQLNSGIIGTLTNNERVKVINQLNKIRKLHKLPPVNYSLYNEEKMNKGALIIAGNNKITHNPQINFKFYSKEGAWACFSGNLFIETHKLLSYKKKHVKLEKLNLKKAIKALNSEIATSEKIIDTFLIDEKVKSLGHRRWILNPFFHTTSFGRIDDFAINDNYHFITAATLKVLDFYKKNEKSKVDSKQIPEFVAYPFNNYPSKLFKRYWFMSFSAICDKNNYWNNKNVKFSSATIKITDIKGNKIQIFEKTHNNMPIGLPNILQWKTKDLKLNTKYYVTIEKVFYNNRIKSFNYWFIVTK